MLAPAGVSGSIAMNSSNDIHAIVDVNGYFSTAGLTFYPLTPCRVVDTRAGYGKDGTPFGPPSLSTTARIFPVSSSSCGIPSNAQAYSFNVTAVPQGPLGYLSIWPANQPYPYVSTLNALDGGVTANAAIVPAGDGRVQVVAGNPTDLIIDVNGYFAPPPGGMYFYPIPPCRVVDTRATGALQAYVQQDFAMTSGRCPIPGSAQAYSLNATALPQGGPLGFLSIWPAGQPYPHVSTLNSYFGNVTSNAAVVPAGTNGNITMWGGNPTHVLLDANGYFSYSSNEGNYVGVSGAVVSSGGPGTAQQFVVHYTSPGGAGDVAYGQMLFTTDPSGPNGSNACQIEWMPGPRVLDVVSPNGSVDGYFSQQPSPLANSSCSVQAISSTLATTGSGYDVMVSVIFGGGFSSSAPIYAYAYGENGSGLSGPWAYLTSWRQTISDPLQDFIHCVSASGSGSCLPLPGGTYTLADPIVIGRSGITVQGSTDPANKTLLVRSHDLTVPMMQVGDDHGNHNTVPLTGVTIQNLTFCGASTQRQGDPSNPCPGTQAQTACEAQGGCDPDLFITNTAPGQSWASSPGAPFNNTGPYNVTIMNCRFEDSVDGHPIFIAPIGVGQMVNDVNINNNVISAGGVQIGAFNIATNYGDYTQCDNWQTIHGTVFADALNAGTPRNIRFDTNTFYGTEGLVSGFGRYVGIYNNTINGYHRTTMTGGGALEQEICSDQVKITGNTLRGNWQPGETRTSGMELYSRNLTVSDNTVSGFSEEGIGLL